MRTLLGSLLVLFVLLLAPVTARSQSGGVALNPGADVPVLLHGQLRPRLESRDPATPVGERLAFTSMRTRLALSVRTDAAVSAFVQLQDVRIWGEEASTLGDYSADGLDFHQAWVELDDEDHALSARLGRQEAAYGGQRLIGAVDWTQQGRAFDGARLRYGGERLQLDLMGFQLREQASATHDRDASLVGSYATVAVSERHGLDLFALWNGVGGGDTQQATVGLRYLGREGPVAYRLEGAWQGGERGGGDVSAYLVGARAGTALGGEGRLTLWYDHLSGGAPGDDEVGVFNTLFATNHKFYGTADLFLDIPAHTAGRGLRDLAVKASWEVAPRWSVSADLHHFRVAEDAGLADAHLGEELDLSFRRAGTGGVVMSGGLSWVMEGEALEPVRGIGQDVVFAWAMLDFTF